MYKNFIKKSVNRWCFTLTDYLTWDVLLQDALLTCTNQMGQYTQVPPYNKVHYNTNSVLMSLWYGSQIQYHCIRHYYTTLVLQVLIQHCYGCSLPCPWVCLDPQRPGWCFCQCLGASVADFVQSPIYRFVTVSFRTKQCITLGRYVTWCSFGYLYSTSSGGATHMCLLFSFVIVNLGVFLKKAYNICVMF